MALPINIDYLIIKPSDSEKSSRTYNYPYQALEEAVVNALYHRDYQESEPVEIAIEPTGIDILSYSGPDRSISESAIKEAKILKARRYRNRRLGDFLKELDLTEGRATGIPTIQKHLKQNGSAAATIQTDDERSYFLITIPCREDMIESEFVSKNETETAILTILENELKNGDFQVYLTDIDNVTATKEQLKNLVLQVCLQVGDNAKVGAELLTKVVVETLGKLYHNEKLSAGELATESPIGSLYKLRRYILNPMIDNGYVEMTQPDKPTSSKQGYRLTEKGVGLFHAKQGMFLPTK